MQVACGFDFSLALAFDGSLFSFGDSSLGQLGRASSNSGSTDPEDWLVRDSEGRPCCIETVCIDLASNPWQLNIIHFRWIMSKFLAVDHALLMALTVFIITITRLYHGRSGGAFQISFKAHWNQICLVIAQCTAKASDLVLQVAAGLSHCIAVCKDGALLAWGWNSAGQLGLGDDAVSATITSPWQVAPDSLPAIIGAGRVHTICGKGTFRGFPSCMHQRSIFPGLFCYS